MEANDDDDIAVDFADDDEPEARAYGRQLLVVGGGRGGSGKTLTAVNLAIYFAQLGKAVTLIDVDGTGSNLHSQFGLPASKRMLSLEDGESFSEHILTTEIPGLSVIGFPHDAPKQAPALRGGRKARYISAVRALPADYIILDIGAGQSELQTDLLLAADLPILVSSCDPPGIEATYRLLRALFVRKIKRTFARDRLRLALLERAMTHEGELPAPLDLVRSIARSDTRLAEVVNDERQRIFGYLVVNQTRSRSDGTLGETMCELARRHLGVTMHELGNIEYDDSAWLSLRRCRPLLLDSPAAKSARNIERLARRTVAILSEKTRGEAATPIVTSESHHYGNLGVSRGTSDEDIRKAYKKKREIYAQGSIAIASLFPNEKLRAEQAKLDEAYDTLLDPIRRRAYDLSTFPEESMRTESRSPDEAERAGQLLLQRELLRELGPDTDFSGAILKKVRESQGVSLAEISDRTRISRTYLEAIEEESPGDLPAAVYVRGFVTELAKYLRLDPAQVQSTYMRRLRERHRSQGQGTA
jgi:flagellar biosynthesis protein FlhG